MFLNRMGKIQTPVVDMFSSSISLFKITGPLPDVENMMKLKYTTLLALIKIFGFKCISMHWVFDYMQI